MTDVPTKVTGDTVTATEWNEIPDDLAAAEARLTALEAATIVYADLTDGGTADAGDSIIDAIEASHSEDSTPADTLRTLIANVIDNMIDADVETITDRINAQPLADRIQFVTGLITGQVAASKIVVTDASGNLAGLTQDVVGAAITDLSGNWTAASASGPSALIFDEDTDNGVNTATVQAPALLASSVVITLPSTTGTLALSGAALAEYTSATAAVPGSIYFAEDTDNGTNKITITAPTSISSDIVLTLPTTTSTILTAAEGAASYQPLTDPLTSLSTQWMPADATTAAFLDFLEDTDNGSNRVRLIGPASTADVSVTLPAKTGTLLTTAGAETLTAGYNASDLDEGTKSSGTYTPNPLLGNFQKAINGGAHTLAPPGTSCTILVQYTNNASAGAITTSGFTIVTGDSFTTTNGDDFFCDIRRCNGFSHLHVTALQ